MTPLRLAFLHAGNPAAPTGPILPSRRFLSAATGIKLRVDAPAVDVAKEYAYELKYHRVQGSNDTTVTLTGALARAAVERVRDPPT